MPVGCHDRPSIVARIGKLWNRKVESCIGPHNIYVCYRQAMMSFRAPTFPSDLRIPRSQDLGLEDCGRCRPSILRGVAKLPLGGGSSGGVKNTPGNTKNSRFWGHVQGVPSREGGSKNTPRGGQKYPPDPNSGGVTLNQDR